jgi:putative membrane protein insertion efficiency factor
VRLVALTGVIVCVLSLQTAAAERATLGAIGFYRAHGSGVMRHFGAECRFQLTCSRYAEQAVRKYGVTRGLIKSAWRVARCNPITATYGEIDNP